MLNEAETNRVWERMLQAEVRALYFAELAARYTKQKQIVTGVSFFLSSGAAATLAGKAPYWVPLVMSSVAALIAAYSMAIGLDRKAATMAKLHGTWNRIHAGYEHLWSHWYEEDANEQLERLTNLAGEASTLGTTEAFYDKTLIAKWLDFVNEEYADRATA